MSGYVAKSDVLNVIRILQSKMDDSGARALENVIGAVEDMIDADVVPVVRCEDCKYMADGKCFFTTTPKDPDDYCSLGEKVTE